MRQTSLLALLAFAVAFVAPATADDERATATTAHYVFSTSGGQAEADEWGRMLEAAWPRYAEFFGAEPKLGRDERLAVMLFDDEAAWQQAIRDGGGTPPGSGGYYCPTARTAYLKRQPSVWYTRTLLLHEAAHQFHYLARTGNDRPTGNWYVEGVAEHLGSHTWDGETLRLGVTPLVSLEDRAGKALAEISRADFSLAALVEAETASRPAAMFLVRYLEEGSGRRWDALTKKLDRGARVDAKAFFRALVREDVLLADWREWLAEQQEPLVSVFVEWDARGPTTLDGTASVVSLCRTRDDVRSIRATLTRRGARTLRAGLVIEFRSPRDYTIAVIDERSGGARLHVDRLRDGRWTRLHDVAAGEPSPEGWNLGAARNEFGVFVSVRRPGAPATAASAGVIVDVATEGPLGLALDACDVTFADLAWE